MNPLDLLGGVSAVVTKVLNFIPDPVQRAEAAAKAQTEVLEFTKTQLAAQAEITNSEAKSADPFTSRARPFIVWVCGVAIGYTFILCPIMTYLARIWIRDFNPPSIDSGTLMSLVTAMLGLHVYENVKVGK